LGIAIVNDFKSIEGDRAMGLQSLPVAFGIDTAKWICVGSIDVTQLSVAAYLFSTGKTYYGLGLLALIIPQIILQVSYVWFVCILYVLLYGLFLADISFTWGSNCCKYLVPTI
jgi:chlorophyll synthase